MSELCVIQGDTLDVTLTIENPEQMDIEHVYFRCPSLQLTNELIPLNTNDDSLWGFSLSPTLTVNLRVGRWDFDITALTSSQQYTVISNGQLIVQYKRNRNDPFTPSIIEGIGYTED